MSELWDMVVIGLGPAGAMSAYQATRAGTRVLALDRAQFPRDKVCGCCISQRALSLLRECGLKPNWSAIPLRSVELRVESCRVVFPVPDGLVVSRRELDFALVQHAGASGAEILTGYEARLGECVNGGRMVYLFRPGKPPRQVLADLVILADGLAGTSAGHRSSALPWTPQSQRRFGAACHLPADDSWPPGRVYLAYADGEYVGITRQADDRLLVAAAWRYPTGEPHSLSARAVHVLRRCRLPTPAALQQAVWKGTPPFRSLRQPVAERVLAVGDATGYIEPLTGEGITWALESAQQLGRLLVKYPRWSQELGMDWHTFVTRTLARRRRWAWYLSHVLDYPKLTQTLLRVLRILPGCGHWMIRHLHADTFALTGRAPFGRAQVM